nr:uncharacterized protein LOC126533737 isoform X1 [Dermacentor andersoni]
MNSCTVNALIAKETQLFRLSDGGDDAASRRLRIRLNVVRHSWRCLSGTTPDFRNLGRDVKPEERVPDITNSSDDYEEALMKPVELGPLRQRERKPWGQGRPKSRPKQ